jgi:putative transposase
MPEHIHLLISEPKIGTPSKVMQVLKQKMSRESHARARSPRHRTGSNGGPARRTEAPFWQDRFFDFNVWSNKKMREKLDYMHLNPVERGIVAEAKLWRWSSCRFYMCGEKDPVCTLDPPWEPLNI